MAPTEVLCILALVIGLCNSAYLPIDIKTKNCGADFRIADENEYIIKGTGDFTGTNCSYTFRGEVRDNCYGLCYDMSRGSFINNNETTLKLKTKTSTKVLTHMNFSIGPWCSKETELSVTLEVPDDYEFDRKNPGYEFSVAIYNKCGDDKSMTYDEAIKHLKGYQHGEAFDDKEYKTTIYGVIVGCSLAAVFLVLFGITVLYYRYHFDKGGKSRSAKSGIPEASKAISDHHIRLKKKRESEIRRASRASAEERRASGASKDSQTNVRLENIQMMKF